jgi:ABC-type transporter Mla subunit MlaD
MTLSKLRVVLEASTSAFNRAMVASQKRIKSLRASLTRVGVSLRAFARGARTAVLALAGFGFAAAKMFQWGSAVEETSSKFRTVFAQATDQVSEFLDSFAEKAGLSSQEAQGLISTTGAIIQGMSGTIQESADMSIAITKLAGDLSSFNNIPTAETLNAITTALVGEREPLKRLGITFLEADVSARAFANTGKENVKQLTQLEKATASLQLITERAGVAVGDQDRTMNSAANVAKRLRSRFIDLRDTIGTAMLPAFAQMLGAMDNNTEKFEEMEEAIKNSSGLIISWANLLKESFGAVASAVREVSFQLVETTKTLGLFWDVVKGFGVTDNAVKATMELDVIFRKLDESSARLRAQFGDVGAAIAEVYRGGAENIQLTTESVQRLGDVSDTVLTDMADKIKNLTEQSVDMAETISKNFIGRMTEAAAGGKNAFEGFFEFMKKRLIQLAMQYALFKTLTGIFGESDFITALTGFSGSIGGAGESTLRSHQPVSVPDLGGIGGLPRKDIWRVRNTGGIRQQGMTVNQQISFNVSAIDARDAARFIQEQKGTIAGVMAEATQNSRAYRNQLLGAV